MAREGVEEAREGPGLAAHVDDKERVLVERDAGDVRRLAHPARRAQLGRLPIKGLGDAHRGAATN